MKEKRRKNFGLRFGFRTYWMLVCLKINSENLHLSYTIRYMLDHFSDEKFHEEFKKFLKKFPGNYILPLERNSKRYKIIPINKKYKDLIDQLMFDFNFQHRARFIQYLTYFLYEKYIGSYEEILYSSRTPRLSRYRRGRIARTDEDGNPIFNATIRNF